MATQNGSCTKCWTQKIVGEVKLHLLNLHRSETFTRKKVMLYIWWDWKEIVYSMSCFHKTKQLIPISIAPNWTEGSWDRRVGKAVIDKKRPIEATKAKNWAIIIVSSSIKTTLDQMYLWQPVKNYCSLAEIFYFICCIHLTWYHQISTYSNLYRIRSMENILFLLRSANNTLRSFSLRKLGSSGIFILSER